MSRGPGDANPIKVSLPTRWAIGASVPLKYVRTADKSISAFLVPEIASVTIYLVVVESASIEAGIHTTRD